MLRLFVMFSVLVFAGLALTGCKAEVERTDQTSVAAPQPGASHDAVLVATARRSKAAWAPLFDAFEAAYVTKCPFRHFGTLGLVDFQSCWAADPNVEAQTRALLRASVESTASYLVAIDLR